MPIEDRIREKIILSGIDRIVATLIELSIAKGVNRTYLLDRAIMEVKEIRPLLLTLIEAREDRLEPLIRQLISQKLPPRPLLLSFGNLQKNLDTILNAALSQTDPPPQDLPQPPAPEPAIKEVPEATAGVNPQADSQSDAVIAQEPAATPEALTESLLSSLPDTPEALPEDAASQEKKQVPSVFLLEELLRTLGKGRTFLKDYAYRSLLFEFYFPDNKLGLYLVSPAKADLKKYEALLRKEGMKFVEIFPCELDNYRQLSRKIQRSL